MKNVGTFFNKVLGLNAASRDSQEVTLLAHPKGLLLEMGDDIRYQYFQQSSNILSKNIKITFGHIYGLKGYQGFDMDEANETISIKADNVVSAPYSLCELRNDQFGVLAITTIEAFADMLTGCSCFAKKGHHLYNQNTFLVSDVQKLSLYSNTDVSMMRNVCEAKTTAFKVVGIDNKLISGIKKWLNYANNPKNGTGDTLYVLLGNGQMKLQAQNCAVIFPVSALPVYAGIINKVNTMLDYKFLVHEEILDWESLLTAIKSKDDFIEMDGNEILRTYSSDFISYAYLKEYEAFRLNTKSNALFFTSDDGVVQSTVLFMLRNPEKIKTKQENEEDE